ncbi:MAG: ABC transporter ATP-binding protein, partial [Candidatus Hodarchaeota archaeon]
LLVMEKEMTPGALVTLFTYFAMLAMPTRFMVFSLIVYQRVHAGGTRVFPLLELPTEVSDNVDAVICPDGTPTIQFDNVTFSYDTKPVLSNISLTIHPGEKVAILGSTGSGKSTLVSLLPRFYDPTSGLLKVKFSFETFDLKQLDLKSWREKFGIVHQEPFLFGRSISENITFGIPKVSMDEIEEVARISQVNEFVREFPEKFKTIIGERGVTLSGGQKQRIAIARMLLRRPNIMILDDATSSVDIATENAFQQAFDEFLTRSPYKHTVIFITHRLSSIKMADRIIIMNRGEIIEQGTHTELIKSGRIYPILWDTQEAGMADIRIALEQIAQELDN